MFVNHENYNEIAVFSLFCGHLDPTRFKQSEAHQLMESIDVDMEQLAAKKHKKHHKKAKKHHKRSHQRVQTAAAGDAGLTEAG